MPTSAISTFGAGRVDPLKFDEGTVLENLNLKSSTTFLAGTLIGELSGTPGTYGPYASSSAGSQASEVQVATIGGSPTGGSFQLGFQGQFTIPIAFNATAATVQTQLQALSTVGASNATVAGSAGGPYTITFAAALANLKLPLIETIDAFTGGTNPSIVVTESTAGTPGGNTDGSQNWTHILQYACVTDSSGNITLGGSTSEWGQTMKAAPAYRGGEFSCADIPNLDANALLNRGRLLQGTVTAGRVSLYGR